jgi:spore germination protein YaaH
MKRLFALVVLVVALGSSAGANEQSAPPGLSPSPRTLFWMNNDVLSVESFLAHKDKIDILSPTWYQIDETGLVTGEPQPVVLKAAKEAHVTIIPLFALFNAEKIHILLGDQKAQDEMNQAFVRECRENGYDGVNYDLEDVMWTDRDALSAMVKKTAEVLHKQHLQLQIDVVPNAPGHAGETAFGKWIFQEWRGAYDLQALGEAVDLLCLMTYDQSTHWTTPGPVGGWIWTNENLQYALRFVPREKLSLGIALYGYRWYTGDPGLNKKEKTPNITAEYVSQPTAIYLRDTYGGKEQWDEADHTPWFYFYRDQMREWVFYTNRRAFNDRYLLARENHLAGICSWVLGNEDPEIWLALPRIH